MAAASTKKQIRLKEKTQQRKRLDEIRSLALRQGYVTEDQVVWLLDDDLDPEVQVDQMEEIHSMLNQMHIEVFASEEEAQERIRSSARSRTRSRRRRPRPRSSSRCATTIRCACTCARWDGCRC